MIKGRIYLIVLALILVSVLVAALSHAQVLPRNPQDPMMKEGEMFAVKLIPGGKKLEVLVTGREVANLKMSDVGLTASMIIGDKVYTLEPVRKNETFELSSPAPQPLGTQPGSQLKLKIRYGQKSEQFDFQMAPESAKK